MLSPNHGDRRGQRPELIVLHYTGMSDAASARARLCDPASEVSAHWLVDEDGRTEQLVCETRRAWHAGAGAWQGRSDVNSRSIGIEIVNPGDRPFTAPQMAALTHLLRGIMARWSIPPEAVIAHSDMAPGRKTDPGVRFDWEGLARQGLAIFMRPAAPSIRLASRHPDGTPPAADSAGHDTANQAPSAAQIEARLDAALDALGYPPAPPSLRLRAFRLRHRPWGRGAASLVDAALAADLASSLSKYPGDGAPRRAGGSAPCTPARARSCPGPQNPQTTP